MNGYREATSERLGGVVERGSQIALIRLDRTLRAIRLRSARLFAAARFSGATVMMRR